ncbi:glutamate--tRNA ligase [Bythopirellula goksoeyrii]|uniref:Glutamate--tRNA ligase n=1 Tax=Bythopirellula goksoeyrii TaxID=1400387 RepID=A0A5B9Q784_9BACT|nr:glutamate--tRNA ligase [Bythopirellula goksoeyrii]QEG32766.1 Glutamate--tRNA ligase 1 [Bythopirellula goksoeyrii]
MTVRTRFAPSPTGYLHIGGVRTALFNWLFARAHGGQFVLRVDDTDQQRNVEAALQPILEGFRWLGLDWDEGPEVGGPYGPYYQSERSDKYQAAVESLLASGAAYRDFATTEEIQAEREAAQQAGEQFTYSRRWMAESIEQAQQFAAEGRQAVVRLKMPREGELIHQDLIRGEVRFPWSNEQDHVIQRADGSCLYHLASVVDDNDMQITHVIRAEEHLSNTPRQIYIAQSLGYSLPEYAHLPYVAEPGSKHKLSKRKLDKYLKNKDFAQLKSHGERIAERMHLSVDSEVFNPVIVDFYEQIGFLPDAILNYLLLLGWSLDDKTEEFTRDEMIKHFSLERVNKAPASFDPQKLVAFQDRAMQKLPLKQKVARVLPFLQAAGYIKNPPPCDTGPYLSQICEAAGDRIKVAGDILDYDDFFVADDKLEYDEKTLDKRLRKAENSPQLLAEFRDHLASVETFEAATLEETLKEFVAEKGIKIVEIVHAVRVAITGKPVGFGLFETLAILGQERSLARIDRVLQQISTS